MKQIDFSQPRLQSFNGIFLIFFADLAKRIRQNIYILALPFLQKNLFDDYGTLIYLGLFLLVLTQFIFSYLSYKKFRFSIQEDAFHLDHGVIRLSHVEIPFERIQNINLQQGVFQQILNVVGFEIETAGEGTAEIKIKALDKGFATALKAKLIEEKNKVQTEVEIESGPTDETLESTPDSSASVLFQLDFRTLIKVGVSSNLFKGVGLLLAFFAYLYNFIMDFVTNIYDIDLEEDFTNRIPETLTFTSVLIVSVLVIGFLITVLTTVLKFFKLKIIKAQQNFEVEYGLFKRVNKVIKKSKTQIFEIRTNPIKNLFNIKNVFVSQASSHQLSEKQKIGLVGLSKVNLKSLFKSLFEHEYEALTFDVVHSKHRLIFRYFYKNLFLLSGLSLAVYFVFLNWFSLTVLIALSLFLIFISYLRMKKSSIGVNSNFISIRKGSIDTKFSLIEIHKLQSVKLTKNIFQQYNGHADLVLETASGMLKVEYLSLNEAQELMNYLLFKIESTHKNWI